MAEHVDTLNARMDVRGMLSVRQYTGSLSLSTSAALSKGTASPDLFRDGSTWSAEIYLGDIMVFERPSSGCIVLAKPSVLNVRLAREDTDDEPEIVGMCFSSRMAVRD